MNVITDIKSHIIISIMATIALIPLLSSFIYSCILAIRYNVF